jgi:hypothetical protein
MVSRPVWRRRVVGTFACPRHVGQIYKAVNARYTAGTSDGRTIPLLGRAEPLIWASVQTVPAHRPAGAGAGARLH